MYYHEEKDPQMRIFKKVVVFKELFRKKVVFGIILLFIGVGLLEPVQSTVQAGIIEYLIDPDTDDLYPEIPPVTMLLYPSEGDVIEDIINIQWVAWASEYGSNLSIYLYLCNDKCDNCIPFLQNPYKNTGELQWNTTQYSNDVYTLFIEVKKNECNIGYDSCHFQIMNSETKPVNNDPVKPSQPSGQINGMTGQEYYFTTSSIDPDGDLVYYLWDWGDDSTSRWLGPYFEGIPCEAKHMWKVRDTYNITVKAKDIYGEESNWSDPLTIRLMHSYNPILRFFELLFQQYPNLFLKFRQFLGY